jgi:hypothetical protein
MVFQPDPAASEADQPRDHEQHDIRDLGRVATLAQAAASAAKPRSFVERAA